MKAFAVARELSDAPIANRCGHLLDRQMRSVGQQMHRRRYATLVQVLEEPTIRMFPEFARQMTRGETDFGSDSRETQIWVCIAGVDHAQGAHDLHVGDLRRPRLSATVEDVVTPLQQLCGRTPPLANAEATGHEGDEVSFNLRVTIRSVRLKNSTNRLSE